MAKRVLVIEDEPNILDNIAETLEMEGFDVITANGGREGVKQALTKRPDVVLCDIMMPDFNGYDVLMSLRSDPNTATAPFVFLTALGARSNMRQGMELGADDYITKPFSPDELLTAVETQLKKQRAMADHYDGQVKQLRTNIIRALPHELRTPLTGLMGCADFLMMDYETIDRQSIYNLAEVMLRSATRLHHLIENYLIYTQIELTTNDEKQINAMRAARLPYPEAIIQQTAADTAARFERENDLNLQANEGVIAIADEYFQKIVGELIDNAFKFSRAGSVVDVEAGRDSEGGYGVRIRDRGHGMSEQEINSIGAYNQFNRELMEQQGLGLGLIIARLLTELHEGEFFIESELNAGTTVTVYFRDHTPA